MKLLLTGAFRYTEQQIKEIEALGYDIIFVADERKRLNEKGLNIDVSEIDAVVCNGLFLYNDISLFKSLKHIQLTSAGIDRVPLDYIKAHAIHVSNARGVYSTPIAEWTVLKTLEIYKKSLYFYKAQGEHKWIKQRNLPEMAGKTAAIIGFGSIGTAIAKRLRSFDVKIIAVDSRSLEPVETELVDEICKPEEIEYVLGKSDIVILTLPLTDKTYHLMDGCKFDAMKGDSILINVSRGSIIDEASLIRTLNEGKLLGAALDVFEEEPLPEISPLWDIERVIITPHNAFASDKINDRLYDLIYKNLSDFMNGNN